VLAAGTATVPGFGHGDENGYFPIDYGKYWILLIGWILNDITFWLGAMFSIGLIPRAIMTLFLCSPMVGLVIWFPRVWQGPLNRRVEHMCRM